MKRFSRTLLAFSILSILYLLFNITLPANLATTQSYHLSITEYRVLVLLVGVPLIAVWFASFYGYALLDQYVHSLHGSADAKAFKAIARGLRYLAWGLPIIGIVSTLLGGIVHGHRQFTNEAFIIVHYLPAFVALVAFSLIGNGSRALTEIVKVRPSHTATRRLLAAFTSLGIAFTYVTITTGQAKPNPYHLPMWLILFTIIAPYLYAWFMGLFASYEIFLYSTRSKGVLYKRALAKVMYGIVITIVTSVVFQYTQSDTTRLRRISFSWVFIGVYLLLVLYASGFLLIGQGAKQLKKIEEV